MPQYRIDHSYNKKIDYALFIDPSQDQDDSNAVDLLWHRKGSINHTDFTPLQKRPIAISVETKRTNENLQRANIQMGVWQGAQWRVLEQLAGPEALAKLEFLPALVVQGHEWKFVASSYSNSKTVCDPWRL